MKKCTLCKLEKKLTQFNKKSSKKDGLQDVCRECSNARSRKYYEQNKIKHRLVAVKNRKIQVAVLRKFVLEYKTNVPCSDCKQIYIPFQMDFDHVLENKIHNISKLVQTGCSLEKIKKEIAKCELVCANCHRLRTWNRMQNKLL